MRGLYACQRKSYEAIFFILSVSLGPPLRLHLGSVRSKQHKRSIYRHMSSLNAFAFRTGAPVRATQLVRVNLCLSSGAPEPKHHGVYFLS